MELTNFLYFLLGIIVGIISFWVTSLKKSNINYNPNGRSLIYYCISGDDTYINLGYYAIKSLIDCGLDSKIDILILTQDSFKKDIQKMIMELPSNERIIIKSIPDNLVNPYTLRLEIFNIFPEVCRYNRVLYLDTDTVVINNRINELFSDKLYLDIKNLHVFREPGITEYNSMFTIFPVPTDHQRYLFSRNLHPFNSGTFLFCPTKDMKNHFANVDKLRKDFPVSHYDQDYLNYYFNVQKLLTDNSTLENYVELVDCLNYNNSNKTKSIIHFYNHTGYGKFKLKAMKEFVKSI